MSQQLRTATRKDGKASGMATRLHNSKNNLTLADIFKFVFFNKPIQNKVDSNGKSTNKNR